MGLAWAIVVFSLLALGGVAAAAVVRDGTPVTVEVDGYGETVRSLRHDVGTLLNDLGLRLRPEDRLQPPADTSLTPGLVVRIQRARPVLIQADGWTRRLYTHAASVGELLEEADLKLAPHDEVWLDGTWVSPDQPLAPPPIQAPPRTYARGRAWAGREPQDVRLTIRRAVPITVDDGSVPYTIYTTAPTIGEALLREQVTLYLGDQVQPSLGSRVSAGLRVVIQRSKPVLVTADGRTLQTRTRGKTVGDALIELGIVVAGSDRVTPALHEGLRDHMAIKVVRVLATTMVESQVIPYESIMAPDDTLEIDNQRLAQEGRNGEYRRRYQVVYEDGVEVSRKLTDEWMAVRPTTRVVSYGTKIVSRQMETPDGVISYWRKTRMYATSYSPIRSGTPITAPWYGRTRLGWTLRKGIVAVDPKVIPLQSQLYIPGYGIAAAGDTGGGVVGRWVDLGYSDDDYVSWHWWVDVYWLDPPPPRSSIMWVLPDYPRFKGR